MSEQGRTGGIHVGNVAQGEVSIQAGGVVVGGNKTTTTTIGGFATMATSNGFKLRSRRSARSCAS
jgi:hypothetical protein